MSPQRDYNEELKDTKDHKYAYNFDFDVMHPFMIKSFQPFFRQGNVLELGSFEGAFTKRLLPYFSDITCVEASENAINIALGNAVAPPETALLQHRKGKMPTAPPGTRPATGLFQPNPP